MVNLCPRPFSRIESAFFSSLRARLINSFFRRSLQIQRFVKIQHGSWKCLTSLIKADHVSKQRMQICLFKIGLYWESRRMRKTMGKNVRHWIGRKDIRWLSSDPPSFRSSPFIQGESYRRYLAFSILSCLFGPTLPLSFILYQYHG